MNSENKILNSQNDEFTDRSSGYDDIKRYVKFLGSFRITNAILLIYKQSAKINKV